MAVKSTSNLAEIERQFDELISQEVAKTADELLRIVQESYRAPKSGRVYRVGSTPTKGDRKAGRRFRGHRASAPGEAPAIDTGALSKGTTRSAPQKVGKMRWTVYMGVTQQSGRADVAQWLERGTSRIRPRPAWAIALDVLRARRSNLKG